MRFTTILPGLSRYPPVDPPWSTTMEAADFQRVARTADQLGYDAIMVPEHMVLPPSLAETMGAHWPHAFTAMAFVAGATERIAVNSSVIVLPYHDPLVLAKAVATLDVLSGGRVMLSFGVGHARQEFEALGVPFEHRGRIADEYLEAMKVLWTQDQPSYRGEFVSFADVLFEPKPVQRPHPPIWIGGNSPAALRRAAAHGDGWFPWLITAEELPGYLRQLAEHPDHAGKAGHFDVYLAVTPLRVRQADHRPLADDGTPVPLSSTQEVIDAIGRLAEIGVTWTSVPFPGPRAGSLDQHLDHLAWAAADVLPHFRST